MVMAPPLTQQYRLASMAARLSSTGFFHYSLFLHFPSIHLSAVNSSPHLEIAPQSLNSSSQPLSLPADVCPCLGYVWLQQGCLILIPFRLPQISCFTLSLKCFSSDSDNCPVPSSYRVLCGSIYSFPPVRYSCLLSAEVLHALLCLKLYSCCICGERCTSHPHTLLPSCSLCIIYF